MSRKPKPKDPEESALEFSEDQNLDPVEIEIEEQKGGSILEQADRLLNKQPVTKTIYNQRYKEKRKAKSEDFSNVVVTLLTLILAAWDRPSDLKPNEDEIGAFSVPCTRMLLRHIPLTAKLSQDALDVIGMVGAASAYYVRTKDAWSIYNQAREKMQAQEQTRIAVAQSIEDDPFKFHTTNLSSDEQVIPEEVNTGMRTP